MRGPASADVPTGSILDVWLPPPSSHVSDVTDEAEQDLSQMVRGCQTVSLISTGQVLSDILPHCEIPSTQSSYTDRPSLSRFTQIQSKHDVFKQTIHGPIALYDAICSRRISRNFVSVFRFDQIPRVVISVDCYIEIFQFLPPSAFVPPLSSGLQRSLHLHAESSQNMDTFTLTTQV